MTARAHAAVATDTPAIAAATLQRACACGGSAGVEGKCASCAEEEKLGLQTKLRINPPGDRWEQEADRIAETVVSNRPAPMNGPLAVTPLIQRQAEEEEEEEPLQAKAAIQRQADDEEEELQLKRATPATRGNAARAAAAVSSGGRALSPGERAYFEPRFGRDLSPVRLHTGSEAGASAASIGARAFTLGRNIAFAPGEYAPGTAKGRRLMAHELTHTLQQGAVPGAATVQRQEADEAGADAGEDKIAPEEVFVFAAVTTSDSASWGGGSAIDGVVEVGTPLFPGDVVLVAAEALDIEPFNVNWALPGADIEEADRVQNDRVHLRVVADPETIGEGRTVDATLSAPEIDGEIRVQFVLQRPPAEPDILNPEQLANEEKRKGLKEERRSLTEIFHGLPREERKEARGDFRKRKADLRKRRRAARREMRRLNRENSCSLDEQREVEAAIATAVERASSALARIGAGAEPAPEVMRALARFFHFRPAEDAPDATADLLQSIADVLATARNSMLLVDHTDFVCDSLKCGDLTGAFVMQNQRGGKVTVCKQWLAATAEVECASAGPEGQAYALLHEFCHLSGVSTGSKESEAYVHDEGWRKLSHAETLKMADAYSSFAWALGGPSKCDLGGDGE